MNKIMKFLSIFLLFCGSFVFFGAIIKKDVYDIALGILALALGILAYKNYK